MAQKRIGELLLEKGLVSPADLERALAEHRRWGGHLGGYLVAMNMVREDVLIRVVAEQLKLPFVDLDHEPVDPLAAQTLPREVCERFNLVAFRRDPHGRYVDVAMSDPLSTDASDALRRASRVPLRLFIAGPRALGRAINRLFYADPLAPPDEALPAIAAPELAAALRPVGAAASASGPTSMPEGGAAELVAERMRRLEVGLRRAERTVQALVQLLVERGDLSYAQIAERVGSFGADAEAGEPAPAPPAPRRPPSEPPAPPVPDGLRQRLPPAPKR